MKLAEALIQRADNKKRIGQLNNRLSENAIVQEGDKPNEDPMKVLAELESLLVEQQALIYRINATNHNTKLGNGTLSSEITKRDVLLKKHAILSSFLEAGKVRVDRYSRTEIKYSVTFNVSEMQKKQMN